MGASFVITLLMLKVLDSQQFVTYQIVLSCIAILYWFIDLGSIDLVVLSKDSSSQISKYSSGRTVRFLILSAIATSSLLLFTTPQLALIFIAVNVDYFNDSMITYRTVRKSLNYLTLTLMIRKVLPVTMLILSVGSEGNYIFELFLLVLFISNVPWVVADLIKLPFSAKNIWYYDRKMKFNALQQGGNFLQNLDIPLLNLLSMSSIIPSYVVGKRLLQIGSIFGQFQIPKILDTDLKVVKITMVESKIFRNFKLSIGFSCLVVCLVEISARFSSFVNLDFEQRVMSYLCLMISTMSVLTTQQNALIKAIGNFRILFFSTLLSTLAYLLSLILILYLWQDKWLFALVLFFNYQIEYLLQRSALNREFLSE